MELLAPPVKAHGIRPPALLYFYGFADVDECIDNHKDRWDVFAGAPHIVVICFIWAMRLLNVTHL